MRDEDADLVRAALHGDRDAFGQLWGRYNVEAQRWAFTVTGDFVDAEEVAQEAFAQALSGLGSLRDPTKFGGWLRRIVRYRAIDWTRSRQKVTPFDVFSLTSGEQRAPIETHNTYEVFTPEAVVEQRQRWDQLCSAVGKLPCRYATAVRMFYFEEQSQEAIAHRLGTSVPAVKGILSRARATLKEELRRHER